MSTMASRLFAQPFVQAQIKEDIKALRHWPLWGVSIGDRWILLTRLSYAELKAENVSIWRRHHVHQPSIAQISLMITYLNFVQISQWTMS